MRLKQYMDDMYIGITDKSYPSYTNENKDIEVLLKDLNRLLEMSGEKNKKFDLVSRKQLKSPSEELSVKNERKLETLVRKWMKVNEQLEELKEFHKKGLQNK